MSDIDHKALAEIIQDESVAGAKLGEVHHASVLAIREKLAEFGTSEGNAITHAFSLSDSLQEMAVATHKAMVQKGVAQPGTDGVAVIFKALLTNLLERELPATLGRVKTRRKEKAMGGVSRSIASDRVFTKYEA